MSYIDGFIERGFRNGDHEDVLLKKGVIEKAMAIPADLKPRSELFSKPIEEVIDEVDPNWVMVSDPRFVGSFPSIELTAIVTSSVKSSSPMLRLYGKNPDDASISHLGTIYGVNGSEDDAKLVLSVGGDGRYSEVSWHSIDAEVFLKLADQVLDEMLSETTAA